MKAILLSGGIESTAIAFWLRPDIALTVDYGQPSASGELQAAGTIASELSIPHQQVSIAAYPPRTPTPNPPTESHSVWWPFRNQLLVTLSAIVFAEREVSEVHIGLVKGDIYKDCTPAFVDKINRLFSIQERPVKVVAPARNLTTLELLKKSKIPYELLGATTSCHVCNVPCGRCAGCIKAARVKQEYKSAIII